MQVARLKVCGRVGCENKNLCTKVQISARPESDQRARFARYSGQGYMETFFFVTLVCSSTFSVVLIRFSAQIRYKMKEEREVDIGKKIHIANKCLLCRNMKKNI